MNLNFYSPGNYAPNVFKKNIYIPAVCRLLSLSMPTYPVYFRISVTDIRGFEDFGNIFSK